jgi:hypothetical protein
MEKSGPDLIHDLSGNKNQGFSYLTFIIILIVVVVLGIGIGFGVSKIKSSGGKNTTTTSTEKAKNTAGIADKKTFKDQAEGTLREGGVDGEGNFHLERPGGASQNVYLTSTTVDLTPYIGKKVRVWGETFQAEKAGWLMDVGLIEIL